MSLSIFIIQHFKKIFANSEEVSYIYSADGTRVASRVGNNYTYYRGPFIYDNNALSSIQFAEGNIQKVDNSYVYYYQYSDHTGSVRAVSHAVGGSMISDQETDYYPFGIAHTLDNLQLNRWLYSGKELQTQEVGGSVLGLYNFGARFYDPLLGRWFNVDPALQLVNPYLYCGNNHVMFTDPNGEFFHIIIGGIIGGVANWIANGCKFNAKGLASFGIGALAGALSAGIGAGMNVAMAGGTFSSGFLGTASGVASTGFISGAVSGASSGFTGGFITGTGNSWMRGASFTQGLKNGAISGGIGGVTGGILGGTGGGLHSLYKKTNFWNGSAKLDLSRGYGATGYKIGEGTITGKYVGDFEGVSLFESSMMVDNSAATLPGRGIIFAKGTLTKNFDRYKNMLQHEYGHILQSNIVGNAAYYNVIAPESLASAALSGVGNWNHNQFWTETWANYLSHNYFGVKSLLNNY